MTTPSLAFGLVPVTNNGFPVENDDSYRLVFDQAVSGGPGTSTYLQHMMRFAGLTDYLNKKGDSAYTVSQQPDGSMQAAATDGASSIQVGVALNPDLSETDLNGVPVRGLATVRMSLPEPYEVAKIVSFGLSLAELPPGLVITNALIQSLFKPLLQQLTRYVQTTIDQWLDIEVGEDIDALGDTIAEVAGDTAEEVSAETAEVVVDEVIVAELAIDLSVAVPAFAALGVLVAIPLLVMALSKQFRLHLEIDNQTDHDFNWTEPYIYNGAMTAQPAAALLPKMGRAVDSWGDKTDVPVVYQANFSSMNKSGYEGTGIALQLAPTDYPDQNLAVLISIPWVADNGIWVGDVTPGFNWEDAFNNRPEATLAVNHGNQRFYTSLAIDALSGQNDAYNCVLRIESL